jgi:hypothetical protein
MASALVLGLLAGGCETTGLSPRASHHHYPALITSLYRQNPNSPAPRRPALPLRLAVGQLGETAPPQSAIKVIERHPEVVSSVVGIPIAGVPGTGRRSADTPIDMAEVETNLRAALNLARDLGADYLFVFGGAIDTYRVTTPIAALDFTVVAGCILPGATIHSEGKVSGALLEAESGRAVLVVIADDRQRSRTPTFLADSREHQQTVELRDELIRSLTSEFLAKLGQ